MKKLEVIGSGDNFTAVTTGSFNELREHEIDFGGGVVLKGKVFAGTALGATGSEISFQTFAPGEGSTFLHAHKTHEELYIIVSGKGEFQVDDKTFAVAQGSVVRVAPAGMRALRNTGADDMVVICIQYKANSFGADDTPFADGVMAEGGVEW